LQNYVNSRIYDRLQGLDEDRPFADRMAQQFRQSTPECLRISPEIRAVRSPFETRLGPRNWLSVRPNSFFVSSNTNLALPSPGFVAFFYSRLLVLLGGGFSSQPALLFFWKKKNYFFFFFPAFLAFFLVAMLTLLEG
jgi:hypothetical protein